MQKNTNWKFCGIPIRIPIGKLDDFLPDWMWFFGYYRHWECPWWDDSGLGFPSDSSSSVDKVVDTKWSKYWYYGRGFLQRQLFLSKNFHEFLDGFFLNNQLYWHFLYCFGFNLKKNSCRKTKCLLFLHAIFLRLKPKQYKKCQYSCV